MTRLKINRVKEVIDNLDIVTNGLYQLTIDKKTINIKINEIKLTKLQRIMKNENVVKINEN